MAGARDLSGDVDIDLAGLMSEIWRKKGRILLFSLLVGAGLVFVLSNVAPRYSANARVLIEKRESVFTRRTDGDFNLSGSQFDEQAIGSQLQVLTSDDIVLKVIAKLKIAESKEFSGEAKPGILDRLKSMIPLGANDSLSTPGEKVLKSFRERLLVYAADKSRVLVVEFWAHDPDLAQSVPNAIVDEYLVITKQSKLAADSEATGWLGPEIEELRGKVHEAEAKVAEFRSSSDILLGNNNALLATQQLSEVSSELSRLRADRSAAEAKVASIAAALQGGAALDAMPEVISSPLIQRLRERQVSLQAEISEFSTSLLPNHPKLKALQSQVADFDGQIRLAARSILKSLENNVDLVRKQETVLLGEVERLKAESSRVGEAEVGLRALEREANAQRELLETYLTQYREAAGRQNRDYLPVDARIISRAIRPAESYFPKIVPFSIAGAAVAFILANVTVLASALLTGRALRPVAPYREEPAFDGIETGGPDRLPVIDAPGLDGSDLPGIAGAPANDPETFAFAHAAQAISGMDKATIAVVSSDEENGAGTVLSLARLLSQAGRNVAVIDLSGAGISSRAFLGEVYRPGLIELMAGGARFADVIYRDRSSAAQVLPCYEPAGEDMEMPIDRLVMLAGAMANTFEFLLLDCGDAGPQGLARLVDTSAIVLVCAGQGALEAAGASAATFRAGQFLETVIVRFERDSAEALAGAA